MNRSTGYLLLAALLAATVYLWTVTIHLLSQAI